jgi:hypothetical protein
MINFKKKKFRSLKLFMRASLKMILLTRKTKIKFLIGIEL